MLLLNMDHAFLCVRTQSLKSVFINTISVKLAVFSFGSSRPFLFLHSF